MIDLFNLNLRWYILNVSIFFVSKNVLLIFCIRIKHVIFEASENQKVLRTGNISFLSINFLKIQLIGS